MRSNPYLLNALKYATLTVAAAIILIFGAALVKQGATGSLTGRLVQPQDTGVVPTARFDAERSVGGFLAPVDTHVFFNPSTRIPRITFFGGSNIDTTVRYWVYCFSPDGSEAKNKAEGKTGADVYTGTFGYSLAERKTQILRPAAPDNDIIGILENSKVPDKEPLASIREILYPGLCYVMIDGKTAAEAGYANGLPAGIDIDGDDLNAGMETKYGTDPNNPDTDRDGVPDGIEVFVAKTNPLEYDTDHDRLPDGCEDKNRNGIMDRGETSPLSADSDHDTLCDGDGYGAGCPEDKQTVCSQDADNQRVCSPRPVPPYGEDMNNNCIVDAGETDPKNPTTFGIPDFDYKFNAFVTKYGVRPSGQGTAVPEFPIPGVPVDTRDAVR